MDETADRILVLHPGALGDVLQAVPALRALGQRGRVTLAGQSRLAALLRDTGVVAEARSFDTLGLEALFTPDLPPPAAIRQFERVVSWFGAADATFTRRLRSAAPCAVIASPTGPEAASPPVWRHLLDTVAGVAAAEEGNANTTSAGAVPLPGTAIGDRSPPDLAPLVLPADWRTEAKAALARIGVDLERPVLLVHPGAGGARKRWPVDRFAAVIERLGRLEAHPVVHRGPADREVAAELVARLGRQSRELVEPDLPLLSAVLAEASAYLGGDSGVSQLAAAVGTPGVIVYPPDTLHRWAPWSPTALALPADDVADRPDEIAVHLGAHLRRGH